MNIELMPGFKFIPGFEGYYSINMRGKIWSHRACKFLSPAKSRIGYLYVLLQKEKREDRKHYYIHRLVAETFIYKPKCNKKLEVNHKDGNKQNNCVPNLEWVTHSQNAKHSYDIGLHRLVEKMEWWKWAEEQLLSFELTPYNIPSSGFYEYPPDLSKRIQDIQTALELQEAVSF